MNIISLIEIVQTQVNELVKNLYGNKDIFIEWSVINQS